MTALQPSVDALTAPDLSFKARFFRAVSYRLRVTEDGALMQQHLNLLNILEENASVQDATSFVRPLT